MLANKCWPTFVGRVRVIGLRKRYSCAFSGPYKTQRRRCTLISAGKTTENSVIITVQSLALGLVFNVSDTQRPNGADVHRKLPKTTENSVIITV